MRLSKETYIDLATRIIVADFWTKHNNQMDLYRNVKDKSFECPDYPELPSYPSLEEVIKLAKRIDWYIDNSNSRLKFFIMALDFLFDQFDTTRDLALEKWEDEFNRLPNTTLEDYPFPTSTLFSLDDILERAHQIEEYINGHILLSK